MECRLQICRSLTAQWFDSTFCALSDTRSNCVTLFFCFFSFFWSVLTSRRTARKEKSVKKRQSRSVATIANARSAQSRRVVKSKLNCSFGMWREAARRWLNCECREATLIRHQRRDHRKARPTSGVHSTAVYLRRTLRERGPQHSLTLNLCSLSMLRVEV